MIRKYRQTLIAAVVLIGILIISLFIYHEYVSNNKPKLDIKSDTTKLTGNITDVVDGRPIDGHCFMRVNDIYIIVEPSAQTLIPAALNGPFGRLIIDGQTQDAKCEDVAKYKGRNAEVYASDVKDDDNIYLSIYGSRDYYIKIDP